jgi:hypothetical protein
VAQSVDTASLFGLSDTVIVTSNLTMTSEDPNSGDPVHTTYTIYRAPNGGDPDLDMFLGHFYDWVEAELNRRGSLHEKEVYLEWTVEGEWEEAKSSFVTAMEQPNLAYALNMGRLIEYEPYSGGDLELKEGICPERGHRYYLKYPGMGGQAPLMNVPCPLTKVSCCGFRLGKGEEKWRAQRKRKQFKGQEVNRRYNRTDGPRVCALHWDWWQATS